MGIRVQTKPDNIILIKTPIIFAVELKNKKFLIGLLKRDGANPNESNEKGRTPIYYAIKKNNMEFIKILLNFNADIHKEIKGKTPPLIYKKVNINENVNDQGMNLLHYSSASGHLKFLEILLELELDVNKQSKDGSTPLLLSIKNGHLECSVKLIKAGADVTISDVEKKTAL
ncbi:hypothetical protein PIROE2DRAFT_40000, partial [Piromyces sp. E2]